MNCVFIKNVAKLVKKLQTASAANIFSEGVFAQITR